MPEINYNIVSLIDFLGIIQGVLLGVILIFSNRKNRPSLFLGLFLITFSSGLISTILRDTKLLELYPNLLFLPFEFNFLSPVLLFLYAKSLIKNLTRKDYWLLLPGIIELIVFFICFCFPPATKLKMLVLWEESLWDVIYAFIFLLFILYFIIKIIRLIRKHQIQVGNYFSDIQNRELKWVKLVAWYQIATFLALIVSIFLVNIVPDIYLEVLFALVNVIFIYWVSLHGLKQARIEIPIFSEQSINEEKEEKLNVENIVKEKQENSLEDDFQYILKIIENEKPYINPELTLTGLADLTQMSTKKLSHIINQKATVNFNTFINEYRIEEAKKMLINPEFNHLNVVGIGYEVGFNSKATFYNVFKKMTDTTPAKFKKAGLHLLDV